MSTNEDKKGIVLNRMYTGSYLSTNLGHEVINMFQADNGRHYLYLNAKGNFSERGKQVGTMLLVRGINDNRVEVVGMAKNLNPVESANCTLPRDLGRVNGSVRQQQKDFLESKNVTYGDVPIIDIFGEKGQQSVYVSYWVEGKDFFRPKDKTRIIIEFPPSKKNTTDYEVYMRAGMLENKEGKDGKLIIIRLKQHNFSSQSLHQFILEGVDWESLSNLCNDNLWVNDNTKVDSQANVEKQEISLFDICQIQKDENRISNALSYFIDKYPKLWSKFFADQLNPEKPEFDEIESVTREESAKVEGENWKDKTGGRVDLLIRTKSKYVIIENKIDSSLIVDNKDISQIERYYNYVEYLRECAKEEINIEIEKCMSLHEKKKDKISKSKTLDGPRVKRWNEEIDELEQKIGNLRSEKQLLEGKTIIGFVLAPDYNMPGEDERQIKDGSYTYQELCYSMIYDWLENNAKNELSQDVNFKAFHDTIKRHTYKYESQSLYEDMKSTFFTRIKELRSKIDNNA